MENEGVRKGVEKRKETVRSIPEWKKREWYLNMVTARRKRDPVYGTGRKQLPYSKHFTTKLKILIKKRDKYTCQICKKKFPKNTSKLQIHHIDYDKMNSDSENLITLCIQCHGKINAKRTFWYGYLYGIVSKGPMYPLFENKRGIF